MKFTQIIIVEWYDNITKAFCKSDQDEFYYCHLIFLDTKTDVKVYLSIPVRFFVSAKDIQAIIGENSIKENWDKMSLYLKELKEQPESYLIKTGDLKGGENQMTEYAGGGIIDLLRLEFPDLLAKDPI